MKRIKKNIFVLILLLLICGFATASFADDDFDDDDDDEREERMEREFQDYDRSPAPAEQTIQAPVSIAEDMDGFLTVEDKDKDGIDDAFESAG